MVKEGGCQGRQAGRAGTPQNLMPFQCHSTCIYLVRTTAGPLPCTSERRPWWLVARPCGGAMVGLLVHSGGWRRWGYRGVLAVAC